jgi:hypothetical protein
VVDLLTRRTPLWKLPTTESDERRWSRMRRRGFPPGAHVRILDLHPEDAYAGADGDEDCRHVLRGRTGIVGVWGLDGDALTPSGYVSGVVWLDDPPPGFEKPISFYAVRVERVPHGPLSTWEPDYGTFAESLHEEPGA